jgi:hypothetical protein
LNTLTQSTESATTRTMTQVQAEPGKDGKNLDPKAFSPAVRQAVAAAMSGLEALSSECMDWEANEFKTANQRLYGILAKCQYIYTEKFIHTKNDDERRYLRQEIKSKLQSIGINPQERTNVLTMMVRLVFKSDRQRTHAYAYAISAAIADKIHHENLAAYIEEKGGIEEIKKTIPLSEKAEEAQKKRETAANIVRSEIEQAKSEPIATISCPLEKSTTKVLLTGVVNASGQIDITSVLQEYSEGLERQLVQLLARQHIEKEEQNKRASEEADTLKQKIASQEQALASAPAIPAIT